MSARVDPDSQVATSGALQTALETTAPLTPVTVDAEDRYGGHALPSDHPAWMKDTLSLSQRARALIAKLKPVVVRVCTFWDHRVRSIAIGKERLCVDVSGSYRLD